MEFKNDKIQKHEKYKNAQKEQEKKEITQKRAINNII